MMTADEMRALLAGQRDAAEAKAAWEKLKGDEYACMGLWPGCAGELTEKEQKMLDLLRTIAKAPAIVRLPEGGNVCTRCGAWSEWGKWTAPPQCASDCPAAVLEVLR